jgi:hypothetical protein
MKRTTRQVHDSGDDDRLQRQIDACGGATLRILPGLPSAAARCGWAILNSLQVANMACFGDKEIGDVSKAVIQS